MSGRVVPRNIVVNGRRTSVRLEPDMWAALEEIAQREHCGINRLCSMIDRRCRQSPLTAAIRVFITNYFRTLAHVGDDAFPRDEASRLLAAAWQPDMLWRSASRAGDDFVERTRWSEAVLQANRSAGFLRYYQAWKELHALRGTAPRMADLIDRGMADEIAMGNLNLIDVTAENPARFRVMRICELAAWLYSDDVTNRLIGDLPFRLHSEALQSDLSRAKAEGVPALYWIDHQYRGLRQSYFRLLLPVSDAAQRVTALVSIVRGKNTAPSIYDEPLFGSRAPTLRRLCAEDSIGLPAGLQAAPEIEPRSQPPPRPNAAARRLRGSRKPPRRAGRH